MIEFVTKSESETVEIGRRLGKLLKSGDVVCLIGQIGAGKTAFTRGIADALGVTGHVTSPTFTIVNEYDSKIPLYHFDVYRLAGSEELEEIGFEEYLCGNGVIVIEWADLVKDILPEQRIDVQFLRNASEELDIRTLRLEFNGRENEIYENELKGMVH